MPAQGAVRPYADLPGSPENKGRKAEGTKFEKNSSSDNSILNRGIMEPNGRLKSEMYNKSFVDCINNNILILSIW